MMQGAMPSGIAGRASGRWRAKCRRQCLLAALAVVLLALAAASVAGVLVARTAQRQIEATLQADARLIARSIDLKLQSYIAAVQTVAQLSALRADFDINRVAADARRIGAQFDGWFAIATGGDTLQLLMSTASADGRLPPAEPRANFPEVVRAEQESLRSGRPVVSDAFPGRVAGELVVTTAMPIIRADGPLAFVYFSVLLADIVGWLEETELQSGEFASIADGSRRVIARSLDNDRFSLTTLPEWYLAFTEGRDNGVAEGTPLHEDTPRLFAFQRLEMAPRWTLSLAHPVPSTLDAALGSAWPPLAALAVLLLGGGLAGLLLERSRARADAARAALEASERERLLDRIRAADARKSRLMAVLAHDLRTPLVALLGALDLLRIDPEAAQDINALERIERDGQAMLQLIDDVLELARLGAGELRLRPQPFAASALLAEVADLVRPQAARNGTAVVVDRAELPLAHGDVAALRRILTNFATNAVKATVGGEIRLAVTLEEALPGRLKLNFTVTDTGRGIAPEDVPRLFRDFGTLDREGDVVTSPGHGLGLAICRRLAIAMGGEVGVVSTPDVGSCFSLRIMLPEAVRAPDSDSSAVDIAAAFAGLRVLVADDHDMIRTVTCASLARYGAVTSEAADGPEAVARARTQRFDVILMDMQLPHLDGAGAAVRIRRGHGPSSRARIIALTAGQIPPRPELPDAPVIDAWLSKPLNLHQLAAILRGEAVPEPPRSAVPILDADVLGDLRALDSGGFLARSLAGLVREISEVEATLTARVAVDDAPGASRIAHRLAGACEMLGARALGSQLRNFEDLCHTDGQAALQGAWRETIPVLRATRAAAQDIVDQAAPAVCEAGFGGPDR
jgi:signal transduction histidine kinase/HPt (histidine-containing phosphotransfer) domain-containing protein/ActR/RegA family two-component response regulator